MRQHPDKRDDAPATRSVERGGDAAAEAGDPGNGPSEVIPLGHAPALGFELLVPERRSRVFRPPAAARSVSGMAEPDQVESFRELRTRLLLMAGGAGLTHVTTLVVPVAEGSGASFVTRNLAAAFTLQQRLALVIDCNVGDATQHEALGVDESDGLLEFLRAPKDVPLERLIRPTSIAGLHVIPAGSRDARAERPREHFTSPPMKALLAWLRSEPCDVFLDGPPAAGSPDARLLSDLADFVVLVVGYGRTTPDALARAAAVFDRKKLAGIVFNERPVSPRAPRPRSR